MSKLLKRPKFQVVQITVPNATPAGTLIEPAAVYTPDQDYSFVTGVAVNYGLPGSVQGGSYVQVGLRDSAGGVVSDPRHIDQWIASQAVEPNKKYLDLKLPCDGRKVYPSVITAALSTAQYVIEFTFRLEDTSEEIASI